MTAGRKTLFVLGAGASSEARLPVGSELKTKIASLLDIRYDDFARVEHGDKLIVQALRLLLDDPGPLPNVTPFLASCWQIRDAMPQAPSIDNYLDVHAGDAKLELCGKLAIVRSILAAERNSLMYFNRDRDSVPNYTTLAPTWYTGFMQLLTENCRKEDLATRIASVAIVSFNYDRCFEHFLYHSLQTYYALEDREAAQLVRALQIFHPYGSVGYLPWQQRGVSVDFGEEPRPGQLAELASQIQTFTEGTDPNSSQIMAIRQNVDEADIIVFLGFAFHKLNMQLLSSRGDADHEVNDGLCFATAHGISDSDCTIITSELKDLKGRRNTLKAVLNNRLTCADLFDEYRRSLSLA